VRQNHQSCESHRGRYGWLKKLGYKLMKTEDFEMALDEIV
jgi:hypothetical protein